MFYHQEICIGFIHWILIYTLWSGQMNQKKSMQSLQVGMRSWILQIMGKMHENAGTLGMVPLSPFKGLLERLNS